MERMHQILEKSFNLLIISTNYNFIKIFDSNAASIVQVIIGFPAKSKIFLLGNSFDPPRAGISPRILCFFNFFSNYMN